MGKEKPKLNQDLSPLLRMMFGKLTEFSQKRGEGRLGRKKQGELNPLELNWEGADPFSNADPKSLALHLSGYAAVLSLTLKALPEGGRLLELGCGSGLFSRIFVEFLPPSFYLLATDYNAKLVGWATENFGKKERLSFLSADALRLSPKLIWDKNLVFFCELWEHFDEEEERRLLSTLYQNLPEKAWVIFSTLDRSAYRFKKSGYWMHKREYTLRDLSLWLKDKGNNPFSKTLVYRITCAQLLKDTKKEADLFGDLANRIVGLAVRALSRGGGLEEMQRSLGLIIYRFLGFYREIRRILKKEAFKDYLGASLVEDPMGKLDSSSLVLVTALQK